MSDIEEISKAAHEEARKRYSARYSGHMGPGAVRNARVQAFEAGALWAARNLRERGPMMPDTPPIYLALDLWQAMGMDSREFDAYYERNGWADTWANLLGDVREKYGRQVCGAENDGEVCVMLAPHIGPHMSAEDVGSFEPLPIHTDGSGDD